MSKDGYVPFRSGILDMTPFGCFNLLEAKTNEEQLLNQSILLFLLSATQRWTKTTTRNRGLMYAISIPGVSDPER